MKTTYIENIKINYRKDVIVNTISQILYLLVIWIMTIITPRIGSSADAGIFTVALSISNICTAIATYSINFYVASDVDYQYRTKNYLYFGLTTTFISFFISIIISLSFGYSNDSIMFWSILLFYLFKCAENITLIITAGMQRVGKLYLSGYALILKSIISLLIFILVLFFTKNIVLAFGLISTFAFLYLFFIDFQLLQKYTNESYKFTSEVYKISLKLFVLAFPVFLYGISFATIGSFPRIVLNQYVSREIVGYFGTMTAITAVIQSGISALLVPFLPKITLFYKKRQKRNLVIFALSFLTLILFATTLAFVLSLYLDKWLMAVLYPSDPTALDYANYFKWIILVAGLQAATLFFCLFLIALRKLKRLAIASSFGIISMFAISYPLIQLFKIDGAIYVFAISYGIMLIAAAASSFISIEKL